MKKFFSKHLLLCSFLLCILLGILIVVPNTIVGDGIYHIAADFDYQQIPFNMYENYALKSGSFLYTWHNGLGSNFVGAFSFYNLFSPFSIIGYIFPSTMFPYLISIIYILKYGFAGLFCHLYMKRYVKHQKYILLGSLLYAFSGFQLTNILYYHFHDVVVFFPLLLYAMDRLVYDKKNKLFCIVIVICALTNWFFFIGEVVFLIIYFIIKVLLHDYIIDRKIFFHLAIEAILGVGISSFVLIPVLLFTLSNPRIGVGWSFIDSIKYPLSKYIEIIRGLFFFPDTMSNRSLINPGNYDSVELYLPVVGLILAIAFCFKNSKSFISIIIYVSLLFMFIPILNSSFTLFNTHYYARWFYMPILFFSLASVKTLDRNYSIKSGFIFTIEGMIIFMILLLIYHIRWGLYIDNIYYLIFVIIFTIICILFTLIVYNHWFKKFLKYCIIMIFLSVTIMGNIMIYKYKGNSIKTDDHYAIVLYDKDLLSRLINVRSYSDNSCPANLSLIHLIHDFHSFNSNISGGEFSFLYSVGIEREVSTSIDNIELLSFLGAKNFISCDYQSKDLFIIKDNPEALPIGFIPKDYIMDKEYMILDYNDRIIILKDKVVLNAKQISKYKDLFHNEINEFSSDFQYTNNGFKYSSAFDKPSFLVFQIPYDDGWKATINGKTIPIERVDNGLIGIKTIKGDNYIVFKYFPPGLKIALFISCFSFLLFLIYCFKNNFFTFMN